MYLLKVNCECETMGKDQMGYIVWIKHLSCTCHWMCWPSTVSMTKMTHIIASDSPALLNPAQPLSRAGQTVWKESRRGETGQTRGPRVETRHLQRLRPTASTLFPAVCAYLVSHCIPSKVPEWKHDAPWKVTGIHIIIMLCGVVLLMILFVNKYQQQACSETSSHNVNLPFVLTILSFRLNWVTCIVAFSRNNKYVIINIYFSDIKRNVRKRIHFFLIFCF